MVSEAKKQFVKKIVDKIEASPIVGVVNLENLPTPQLQNMRSVLKKKGVEISMRRKKLINLALNQSTKKDIKPLAEKLKGMPALVYASDNPFTLSAIIQKNKSEAPAKAGQTAPRDIVVKAGGTNFAPGPIISELASVGIKTKVEGGKLAIIDDAVVAKEGDVISQKLAETLKRLDIKPMEVGLDLVAVWEDGLVFDAKQLVVDEDEVRQNFTSAAQWAFNLAIEVAYPTDETIENLLQKVASESKALALEASFLTDDNKEEILARVEREALAVKEMAKIETDVTNVKVESKSEESEDKVEESEKDATSDETNVDAEKAEKEADTKEETSTEKETSGDDTKEESTEESTNTEE